MPLREVYERTTIREIEDAPAMLTSTPADPFMIDHDCINEAGHQPIASCGAVVCAHCARIFWQ